jgi:endoglucanase
MGKMNFKNLEELINLDGVSGDEEDVRKYIRKKINPYVDEIKMDKLGNLLCRKKGKKPVLMLAAHMDEIGLMVRKIDQAGRLFVSAVGGISVLNVIGQTVEVMGKKITKGIITTKEISMDADIEETPTMEEVYIDTGLTKKELTKLGIGIGSYISLERADHRIGNKDFIAGKALDDRIGCFTLIELAKRLKKTKNEIFFVFTVQEEVGLYGAKVSAYTIEPDLAIAVDVGGSDDYNDDPTVALGKGPVLTMKDDEMIGDPCLNDWIRKIAKEKKIPLQLEVTNLGTTDALTISISKGGVPTTALGTCIRNIHSTHSIGSKTDIENLVKLLELFCKKPPADCVR